METPSQLGTYTQEILEHYFTRTTQLCKIRDYLKNPISINIQILDK